MRSSDSPEPEVDLASAVVQGRSAMRSAYTTEAVIEFMAASSGRYLEISGDTAFLTVGGLTWMAPLEPVGEVAA